MINIPVDLPGARYHIRVGAGLLSQTGNHLRSFGFAPRCAVITDRTVHRHYGKVLRRVLREAAFDPLFIQLPPGEPSKSLQQTARCYDLLAAHRVERNSCLIALGGGVVGDLAGFVAATWLRGIPLLQIPTTLLAQVDSSVGGKTGVNLKAGKNLVGAFYQPRLVIADLETLQTLPPREFNAGMAEVIKYGLIRDPKLFRMLEGLDLRGLTGRQALLEEPKLVGKIVARCCSIKAGIVTEDERETGVRAILNFGHTIGHALESVGHYRRHLHGEAIAIGQVMAVRLSISQLGLSPDTLPRVIQLFQKFDLPVRCRLTAGERRRVMTAMALDKKVRDGAVRFVLLAKPGEAVTGCSVPREKIEEILANQ